MKKHLTVFSKEKITLLFLSIVLLIASIVGIIIINYIDSVIDVKDKNNYTKFFSILLLMLSYVLMLIGGILLIGSIHLKQNAEHKANLKNALVLLDFLYAIAVIALIVVVIYMLVPTRPGSTVNPSVVDVIKNNEEGYHYPGGYIRGLNWAFLVTIAPIFVLFVIRWIIFNKISNNKTNKASVSLLVPFSELAFL